LVAGSNPAGPTTPCTAEPSRILKFLLEDNVDRAAGLSGLRLAGLQHSMSGHHSGNSHSRPLAHDLRHARERLRETIFLKGIHGLDVLFLGAWWVQKCSYTSKNIRAKIHRPEAAGAAST
jgi:hypothetical protein